MRSSRNQRDSDAKRAKCVVAEHLHTTPESIGQLFHRLRWGKYALEKFEAYYVLEGMSAEAFASLEESVAVLCEKYLVTLKEARARLGKYRYFNERRLKAHRSRGMQGCYFLFAQRMEATVPLFRMDLYVVLSKPKYWCMAQSVPKNEFVPCCKEENERGECCPYYRNRMHELAQPSASEQKQKRRHKKR